MMTQEEKQILLKDLYARFSYGVICLISNRSASITEELKIGGLEAFEVGSLEVKPYLRPISSMTEEERKQLACKIGAEEIELQTEFKYFFAKYFYCGEYDNNGNECLYFSLEMYIKAIEWFLENHFDYRGLISMGLALEAPKDMYKTA